MSDPTIEEDSLISQDDIDKLMESSSVDDLDENFLQNADDELGELSQDDIDSLMNANITAPEASGEDDDDDDMELISQNDIDQLMNSSTLDDEDSSVIAEDVDTVEDFDMPGEDDFGELSQDDIDNLMNPKASSDEAQNDISDDADEDDFEMISQDDINSLMSESGDTEDVAVSEPEPEPAPEPEPIEASAPESVEEPAAPTDAASGEPEDNDVIDESQAVEAQEALITQETIDGLIKNFEPEPEPEPVILDETPEPEAVSEEMELPEELPEASADQTADEDEFLIPDTDADELDLGDDEDVSQEDIDALLLDDDEDEEDDDILISQDDIDTLLMAADQEDEDVLGDLMDDTMDEVMDDDLLDEDIMETDDFEDELDSEDQVVLEEGGDEPSKASKPSKASRKRKKVASDSASQWYKSKLVIACASALIVLGITVPLTYFIISSDKPVQPQSVSHAPPASTPGAVEKPLKTPVDREVEIETVDVNAQAPLEYKKPGNMILQNFVILAPDKSKELTYITADISIDYADQRAYHEINNHLSFYRDLIYDSINKSLAAEKRDETTEADILWIVETTLKKVLPGNYIKRVSFKSFKAS